MAKYLDSGGLSHLMTKLKGAFVSKSGDTMTGALTTPQIRTGYTVRNVASYIYTGTAKETVIWTGIKYVSSAHMPVVKLNGYAYGAGKTTELRVALYIYQNEFYSSRTVTNLGVWNPNVYLFTYTKNNIEYVAIGLEGTIYYNMFSVDVQDEMGKLNNIDTSGWAINGYADTGHIPVIGTNHCVSVTYGVDVLNPPKTNGHTVDKDVPSNAVFTDTTYSAGTGLSLSGTTFSNSGVTGVKGNAEASYRTGQVNITHANLGTTPVANGGTGQTTAQAAANALLGALDNSTAQTTNYTDDTSIITTNVSGTTGTYYHRKASLLWNYIKDKISSVLGLVLTADNGVYQRHADITVKTGSANQSHITLQTFMTWLITTKKYIPSGVSCSVTLNVGWNYAGNDILQLTADGVNYELQLAGCVIEFDGYATAYNAGVFRMRIHSSPARSFTVASGYTAFPLNTTAEYTCNGSSYNPTWTVLAANGVNAAGTGLSKSGQTLNHSNSVTAGTAGTSSATSGTNTLAVPYVTYDAQGHVTASGTHTHTIGNASTSAYGVTKLESSTSSTSTVLAATPSAVKATYDRVTEAIGDQVRLSAKEYTGGSSTVLYRKLAVLPIDNASNGSSIILSGRCGGWVQSNFGKIEVLLTNRTSAYSGDTVTAAASSSGASGMYNYCDIVVYAQTDKSAIVYLKIMSYYAYDLVMQTCSGVTVDYSTNSVTPTGTLVWSLSEAPQTKLDVAGTLTAPKFVGALQGNVTGNLTGNVTGGIKNASMRPASANTEKTATSLLTHYLATSSMSTGKPMNDGHILEMDWDNNGGWKGQLFVPDTTNNNTHMQWRAQNGGTWPDWVTVLDTNSVVPVANGGTGQTTLAAARNAMGLGNTTGALPVANGGTGKTTGVDAANYFINSLTTGSADPQDNDYYVSQYVGGGTTTTTFHRRPMLNLWNYIKGKISSWMKNNTAKGNLGWTSSTNDVMPITSNTLAYWDGSFNSAHNSNLTYCTKGEFGTAAVANLSDSTSSTSSTAAATSKAVYDALAAAKSYAVAKTGDTMSGKLTLQSDQYTDNYTTGALDLKNSNIQGVNSIYTADLSDSAQEGMHFYRDSTHVDTVYAKSGTLYFAPNRQLGTNGTSYEVLNSSDGVTQKLLRPKRLNGVGDITLQSLFNTVRANRLAFLPADQIIIEKTTDGGSTWVDAGISDAVKTGLFSETRAGVSIPLLNGVKSLQCGIRITFTAMKYNVPSGTAETQKYSYWSASNVLSTERYNQIKEMYFWINANSDTVNVKLERATGANPSTWNVAFDEPTWGMTGWSGNDYIRFGQSVFGGGTTQTGQYWNYRLTFMTRGTGGGTTMSTSGTTSAQSIMEIRGYGDTWWTKGNEYAANDKLYEHDYLKNATFPAKVTATGGFAGALTGNVTGNVTGDLSGNIIGARTATGTLTIGSNTQSSLVNAGIRVNDTRSTTLTPGFLEQAANFYFMSSGMPTSEWWTVLHVKGWTGSYAAWEIAGPAHNTDQRTTPLYVRSSNGSSAWGSWRKLFDSAQTIPAANLPEASTSAKGIVQLNSNTNSSTETQAATPKAVKAAYDLANSANTTASSALSTATGALYFDITYSISNSQVTCAAHVYRGGSEITSSYADGKFTWYYRLGTGASTVSLGTGKTKTVAVTTMGYGGSVGCTFNDS